MKGKVFPMPIYYSVIVPVYRVEAYLRQCLDSILAQTYPYFELILVDDGCPAICNEYQAKDNRVQVLHEQNQGVVAARYAGLQAAHHEYVCFVDSDDYVPANWLQTIHRNLENNRFPDMLLFGLTRFCGDETTPAPPDLAPGYYDKRRLETEVYPFMLYDARQPFYSKKIAGYMCTKAMRREFCLRHYTQDRRIIMYEDVAMIFECIYCLDSLVVISDCPYFYRTNPESALGRYHPEYVESLQRCNQYLKGHLGAMAPELMTSINAYISMRTIDAIAQEFLHDRPFGKIVAHMRQEMDRTGLARQIDTHGLPLHIRLFIGLLQHRLYAAAVLITKLRMK
jgi:glycosyltransferase involved in cell wall biosynthesis